MSACFGFGFGFGKNRIVPADSDRMVSASLGTPGSQDCNPNQTSVPLVDPVAPAPVDDRQLPGLDQNLLRNQLLHQSIATSRAAAREYDGSDQRHPHSNRLPTLLVTVPCTFTAEPPQPFNPNKDNELLRELLSSVLIKNQKSHYSEHAEKLKTYYFDYFQKNGMPTPSDIISHLNNNNREGTATALSTILDRYKTTLSIGKQFTLNFVKKKIVTQLSNLLIEAFNVHQSQLSQQGHATVRAKARRTVHVVSASLETTGTQRCTQGPTLVPLVALSTDVGGPSPTARHPEERQYSASHANHHMTDPEASNPSTAKRPETARESTREEFLRKVMAGSASGACGGTIVGGFPGAFTGGVVGTLCGAISSAVESNWDGDRMTPSLGECVLSGIPFNV